MKKHLLLSMITLIAIACSNSNEKIEPSNSVNIRLRNTSNFSYTDVFVNTGGGEFNYGNLNSKQITQYHKFNSAYRYAYVRLYINGSEHTLQPIDFVGETPLTAGKYTYEIATVTDDHDRRSIILNLVEE